MGSLSVIPKQTLLAKHYGAQRRTMCREKVMQIGANTAVQCAPIHLTPSKWIKSVQHDSEDGFVICQGSHDQLTVKLYKDTEGHLHLAYGTGNQFEHKVINHQDDILEPLKPYGLRKNIIVDLYVATGHIIRQMAA